MMSNSRGQGQGPCQVRPGVLLTAALVFVAAAGTALAEPKTLTLLPMGRNGLPSSFVGEAATVALAFAFPALAAGAYLAARGAWHRYGLRGAMVLSFGLLTAGFGWAIFEARPDLLKSVAGVAATRL